MEEYNCPRCHCGSMFEDHGKMVCMNCDYVCTKLAASAAKHTHSYEFYNESDKKVTVSRPAPQTSFSNTSAEANNAKKNTGCGPVIVIFILFWLFSMFLGIID